MRSASTQAPSRMRQLGRRHGDADRCEVISLGDDIFAFCVGRHVALCQPSRQRLSFVGRDARRFCRAGRGVSVVARSRIITAMTKRDALNVLEQKGLSGGLTPASCWPLVSGSGPEAKRCVRRALGGDGEITHTLDIQHTV